MIACRVPAGVRMPTPEDTEDLARMLWANSRHILGAPVVDYEPGAVKTDAELEAEREAWKLVEEREREEWMKLALVATVRVYIAHGHRFEKIGE